MVFNSCVLGFMFGVIVNWIFIVNDLIQFPDTIKNLKIGENLDS